MSVKTPRERAEDMLVHYLSTVWRKAGLTWDGDNDQEVRSIVDSIVEMVDDDIRTHTENDPHLYPDGSRQ